MDPIELVALILVIVFVISVNIGLIRAARGKVAFPEFELFRRVVHRARDPWKAQDEDLVELSRLVSELKTRDDSEERSDFNTHDDPDNLEELLG